MAEQLEITYADKVFKLSAGQKITFKGGKVMQSDIVAVVSASEVALISFTIDATPYQAEKGMTWYEWANSDYNTSSFSCVSQTGNVVQGHTYVSTDGSQENRVIGSDAIISEYNYLLYYAGSGGGSD